MRQYLSGLSYDEIAARGGVAKGTVANVVSELKAGAFPEAADVGEQIELLRELSFDLKRSNLAPGQCAVGLAVFNRIRECGLDVADVDRWPLILKSVRGEDEANEFVRLVYRIQEVEKKTGLSLEELDDRVHDLQRKTAELEPLSRQREDCARQVAELTRKREELAGEVAGLEQKRSLLDPRVKDMEKREQELSRRAVDMRAKAEKAEANLAALVKEKERLADIDFSPEALRDFSQRVQSLAQRHHIAPPDLRARLLKELESLDEELKLETLVQGRQKELAEQEQAVAVARQEQKSLRAAIDSLKQEKAGIEASIRATREKVGGELARMVPAARDAINGLVQGLQRGHEEALAEVRRLRVEALEAGKEIGRCEGMVEANQWVGDLLALARGEEGVEAKQVRAITLSVLYGAVAWRRLNKESYPGLTFPLNTTWNLIKELEEWKT